MGRILNTVNYLRKGIVDVERRKEKEQLFWIKIQAATALNLLAEMLEKLIFDHEAIEDNLEQAKSYIASSKPGEMEENEL